MSPSFSSSFLSLNNTGLVLRFECGFFLLNLSCIFYSCHHGASGVNELNLIHYEVATGPIFVGTASVLGPIIQILNKALPNGCMENLCIECARVMIEL